MKKAQIINLIEKDYVQKSFDANLDFEKRFTLALKNQSFNKLVKEEKDLSIKLSFSDLKKDQFVELTQKHSLVCQQILDFAKKNNIDLNMYYKCAICHDKGTVNGKKCTCYISILKNALKKYSNLPIASKNWTLDNFIQKQVSHADYLNKIYLKCGEWLNKFETTEKQICYISGDIGIGKTTLSYAVANKALEDCRFVYYTTAFNLSTLFIDKAFNRSYNSEALESIEDCELLIIDDLGTEQSNVISLEALFNLIDNRTANLKKTLICTNLNQKQCIKRYGERIFSRITDSTHSFAPQYIEGESLRKK